MVNVPPSRCLFSLKTVICIVITAMVIAGSGVAYWRLIKAFNNVEHTKIMSCNITGVCCYDDDCWDQGCVSTATVYVSMNGVNYTCENTICNTGMDCKEFVVGAIGYCWWGGDGLNVSDTKRGAKNISRIANVFVVLAMIVLFTISALGVVWSTQHVREDILKRRKYEELP